MAVWSSLPHESIPLGLESLSVTPPSVPADPLSRLVAAVKPLNRETPPPSIVAQGGLFGRLTSRPLTAIAEPLITPNSERICIYSPSLPPQPGRLAISLANKHRLIRVH
jgi:hypothetical protein